MLRRIIYALSVAALFFAVTGIAVAQNPLFIPDTLSSNTFNLNVQKGTVNFFQVSVDDSLGCCTGPDSSYFGCSSPGYEDCKLN